MARIKLPNKALGSFIKAAHSWLSRTVDAKSGLEVRFANKEGKLQVSVGADSNYIEAILTCDPEAIKSLTEIFLDVSSLKAYSFNSENLEMVIPLGEKEDQRIQFITPGFNFRIPRKKGEIWKKNNFDFSKKMDVNLLSLNKEDFSLLQKHMSLPNSFKTDREELQITFSVKPGVGFDIYSYDVGAFWNQFKNKDQKGKESTVTFIEDFFIPCKEFDVESVISFGTDGVQCYGEFTSPSTGIELLRWTSPKDSKKASDIPSSIVTKQKETSITTLLVNPKVMISAIEKACMFLTPIEMREVPLSFSVVANQFALSTVKPSGEGETAVEGELLAVASENISMNLQAACFRDYLSELEKDEPISIQVLKKTLILSQNLEKVSLLYWMPKLPGVGGA